ncbi:HEPN domain-containing protein [Sphingobacterium nematocida]|uniref:HEPN domain-containing protein n=1 Tax=Sphingobacterium nematocida TaxID=1513896 RepID=A0A1T5D733_9SPHI|nr:HEPN domain-containing protein [Sphingobacterium nematocida]SKB67401.1 HEPN domain-containing protein [Sphingobacterium nematocida]
METKTCKAKIPRAMTTALEPNFEIIFKHLTVDEIFLWTYRRNGTTKTIVQIHTHNKQRSRTLRERCERALNQIEGHHFTFYNTKEVQSRINDGLGRLHLNCHPSNRIYLHPEYINSIALPSLSKEELVEQTREYIKREKDKIIAFMEGYHLYSEKEMYSNAAFMLHQALEISLRTAQKLLLGVEERSHSIKQNIDFFKPYDPVLGNLLTSKEEEQAINRLTESYTGSRYKNNFVLDLQKIAFCKDIADRTFAWIEDYEQELLLEIEEKFIHIPDSHQQTDIIKTKINMEKSTNINNNHRDLIHNALETYGQVHGLYCFAYVTRQDSMCNLLNVQQSHNEIHHYYLFAIMADQSKPIVDLQNCVMQLLPEKIKVTLIQETPEQVEKKLKKGDVFRSNLLQIGEYWYEFKSSSIISKESSSTVQFENFFWTKRFENAYVLHNTLKEPVLEHTIETYYYIIGLSIEQICMGLIKHSYNFIPTSTNLNYLMDLCDSICPNVSSIFPRNTLKDKKSFNRLIKAQQKFKFSSNYFANGKKIEVLIWQLEDFIASANSFMKTHFKQQDQLQEANKIENIEQCA